MADLVKLVKGDSQVLVAADDQQSLAIWKAKGYGVVGDRQAEPEPEDPDAGDEAETEGDESDLEG